MGEQKSNWQVNEPLHSASLWQGTAPHTPCKQIFGLVHSLLNPQLSSSFRFPASSLKQPLPTDKTQAIPKVTNMGFWIIVIWDNTDLSIDEFDSSCNFGKLTFRRHTCAVLIRVRYVNTKCLCRSGSLVSSLKKFSLQKPLYAIEIFSRHESPIRHHAHQRKDGDFRKKDGKVNKVSRNKSH